MLAPGVGHLFVFQHHQAAANALTRVVRQDDVVNVAALSRHEGVGKTGFVLGLSRRELFRVVFLFKEYDLNPAVCAPNRHLGSGPRQVHIPA